MLHDAVPALSKGQPGYLLQVAAGLDELTHPEGGAFEVIPLSLSPGPADLHFRRFISIIDYAIIIPPFSLRRRSS